MHLLPLSLVGTGFPKFELKENLGRMGAEKSEFIFAHSSPDREAG
jgi:hypothetical protein